MLAVNAGGPSEWNPRVAPATTISTLANAAISPLRRDAGRGHHGRHGRSDDSRHDRRLPWPDQAGPNALDLTGTSTYSGPTVVSAGTLAVNGALLSIGSVTVNNGALLSGIGSVGNRDRQFFRRAFPGSCQHRHGNADGGLRDPQ